MQSNEEAKSLRREQADGKQRCGNDMLRHSFCNSLEPQIISFYSEPQDFPRADKGVSYRK